MKSRKDIYILGAGNMARETYYICQDLGLSKNIRGFLVESYKISRQKPDKLYGKKIIYGEAITDIPKSSLLIGAIGSAKRRRWIEELEKKNYKFTTIVHPSVSLWKGVEIGMGCIISKGAVLTCDIKIGRHTIININSNINHDCVLEDFVTIGPGSHIGGNVRIGKESWIGIGTTVIHNIRIGKGCFIAAGSVVVKDIPDFTLAMGVPAKPVRRITDKDWDRLI